MSADPLKTAGNKRSLTRSWLHASFTTCSGPVGLTPTTVLTMGVTAPKPDASRAVASRPRPFKRVHGPRAGALELG